MKTQVMILSCNRQPMLTALIDRLLHPTGRRVDRILVYDDHSDPPIDLRSYGDAVQLWVAPKRHGRTEMWKLYKKMLQDAGNSDADIIAFLQDDLMVPRSFCDIIVDYHDTVAFNILQLMLDINRDYTEPMWGIGKHETYQDDNGDYYLCTQWVETAFSCTRETAKRLGAEMRGPPADWFRTRDSSGTFCQISRAIHRLGEHVAVPPFSVVRHDGNQVSQLHQDARDRQPIISKDYQDD